MERTMAKIIFEPLGDAESFAEQLKSLEADSSAVMILACDANEFTKEALDPILQESSSTLIGAIFPSIIYKNKKYDKGTILIGLSENLHVNILSNISQKDFESVDAEVEEHMSGFDENVKTIFAFVDGLTSNIGYSINALFDNYGLDINYIGGGSGSLSFMQKPSLFTNAGLLQDAFVYAYSTYESSVGVQHGWKSIKGPFEVTESDKTVIKMLDHRPAFELYKEVVDTFSAVPIEESNFFDVAKSFPFGINTINDEKIVRDPIVLSGTDLVCVGNVAVGSYVDILQGYSANLIDAAKGASQLSNKEADFEVEFMLFIDCISRVLFLEEEFDKELDAVYEKEIPLVGALTFGEIANNGHDYLEFYNKTAVVGRIGHAR